MSTSTYFNRDAILAYHGRWHDLDTREEADSLLDEEGYCNCCGVDYTGLDRDDPDLHHQDTPLEPHPWAPGMAAYDSETTQGKVDFDDDEGTTIASVRITRTGGGYLVHIDQFNDRDNLVIVHTND